MKMALAPTTRLAIRAAVVATAAVLVARLSFLERPYWIILTAVLLIFETAGESIKRSGQRLGMTVLGCLCGWGIYLVAGPIPALRWSILLGGIFLAVYFRSNPRGVVYAPMIFFASVYVVFIFAVVDSWTARLMLTRLYDTAIGCGLALAGSLIILPQHAGRQLEQDLESFWDACRDYFEKTYASLTAAQPPPTAEDRQELLKKLELLRARSRTSAYEAFLNQLSRERREALVDGSEHFCRHLLAFGATVQAGLPASAVTALRDALGNLAGRARAGFERLSVNHESDQITDIRESAIDGDYDLALRLLKADHVDRFEFLQLGPAVYHLEEACRWLEAVIQNEPRLQTRGGKQAPSSYGPMI